MLSPQLTGTKDYASLPYASTLCGACFDACPVAIDIPSMLVHLRSRVVDENPLPSPEAMAMRAAAWTMSGRRRWTWALRGLRLGRILGRRTGRIRRLPPPLSAWTASRDAPRPTKQTFRDWWSDGGGRA